MLETPADEQDFFLNKQAARHLTLGEALTSPKVIMLSVIYFGFVGASLAMQRVYRIIDSAAQIAPPWSRTRMSVACQVSPRASASATAVRISATANGLVMTS